LATERPRIILTAWNDAQVDEWTREALKAKENGLYSSRNDYLVAMIERGRGVKQSAPEKSIMVSRSYGQRVWLFRSPGGIHAKADERSVCGNIRLVDASTVYSVSLDELENERDICPSCKKCLDAVFKALKW
jgi:hypothetical protein